MFTGWVTLPRLINFTQAGYSYPEWLNIKIKILIKHTWDYLRHSREEEKIMLRPKIYLSQKKIPLQLYVYYGHFSCLSSDGIISPFYSKTTIVG